MRRVPIACLACLALLAAAAEPAPIGPQGWIALSWNRCTTLIAPVGAHGCRVATYAQEGELVIFYGAQVRRKDGGITIDASASVAFGSQAARWSPDSFVVDLVAGTVASSDAAGRTHAGTVLATVPQRTRLAAMALGAGAPVLSLAEAAAGAAQSEPWTPERLRAQCLALLSAPEDDLRMAAIRTLAQGPGDMDVLLDHLRRNADTGDGRLIAAELRRVKLDRDLAQRVFALWRSLDAPDVRPAQLEVRDELLASLSAWDAKRFALHQVQALQARIARLQRRDDMEEQTITAIQRLAAQIPREHLYRFVPVLTDQLGAFFPSRQMAAHAALVAITGVETVFTRGATNEERSAVAEQYRELYYTSLKAKIPPLDPRALADPFAAAP